MERGKILKYVAPCSLICYTCMASKDGAFSECGPRLDTYSEGICEFLAEIYGESMSEEDLKKHYAFFEEFHGSLKQLSGGQCHGCRSDPSLKRGCIPGCTIPECVKEHGVDFCGECSEFPCAKVSGEDTLHKRMEEGSREIKETGAEAYFEKMKDVSHYAHYKKETAD